MKHKSTPNELSHDTFARLYSGGSWFQFPRHFLLIMTSDEAILLSFLIAHSTRDFVRAEDRNDGWFYCLHTEITAKLFANRKWQSRVLKSLQAKGFLRCYRKGVPPKRWIKVDYTTLHDAIENALQNMG